MQRRIEQANGDRLARHDAKQFGKIRPLHGQQFGQCSAAARCVIGEDHLSHRDDPLGIEKHVLRATEPDALGTKFACDFGIFRRFGIGPHAHRAKLVRPVHEHAEVTSEIRRNGWHLTFQHFAARAINGYHITFGNHFATHRERALGLVDA